MIRSPDDTDKYKQTKHECVFPSLMFFFKLYFANQLQIIKSPFMPPEPDDLQTFISKCRTMDIEELKSNIDDWEGKNDCSIQKENLDIAYNELELKYKERQEQIDLLTKSLTSSSRIGRWISSFKAVINQFVDFKSQKL